MQVTSESDEFLAQVELLLLTRPQLIAPANDRLGNVAIQTSQPYIFNTNECHESK